MVVEYDGCLLPDDPANESPWSIDPGSNGAPYIDSCQLVIPVNLENGYYGYRRYEEALQTAESYAMEVRVRAEDVYLPGAYVNASFGLHDGLKVADISLTHNPVTGETWVVTCGQEDCASLEVDWTAFHGYRLEVEKGDEARFFVDGQYLYVTSYDQLNDSNLPPNLAVFGGAESISYWDLVSYEICGSAAPQNLPPIAQAATHLTVTEDEWAHLDGSASQDPEEQPLTYLWTQTSGPTVQLDDPGSPTPGFYAPPSPEPQQLDFELVVNDGQWDSQPVQVRVDTRPAPEAPVSIGEQGENVSAAVDDLAIPRVLKRMLHRRLNRAMRRPTDAQKSQAMFRLGRFVFQLKRVGLVRVDTTRFDASLEYTRKLLAAGAGLEDGYAGLIAVRSVEALETAFVPGERDARFSVHVELSPRGPLVWPRRRQKALTSRVGIIDAVSGQVVRTLQTDTVPIEGLEPGEVYQHEIEVAWDGLDDDGEPVELDRSFYVAVFPEAEVMGGAPLPLPWPPQQTFQPVDIAGTIIVQPIPKYLVGSQTDRCNATPPGSHGFPDCDRPGVVCFVEGVSYLPTGDDEYGYEVVFCEPGTVDQFLAPPYYYHCAEAVDSNEYYAQGWDGHQGAQATFRITRWELPPYVEVERHMFQLTGPNEEFPWDINRRHEVYSVPLGHDAAVFVEVLRYLPAGAKKLQWAARAVAGKNLIGVAARTIGGNYDSVVTIRWTILHWPARHSSTYLQYFERIARANNQSHGSCSALPRLIATPTMYSGNSKMELYGAFMWWFDYYALQKPLNVLSNIGYLAWDGRAEAQTEEPEDEFVEDFYLFTEAMDEALQRIMSYRTGINSDNDISMDVEVTEHEGGRCHFLSVFDGNSLSLGEETVWMLHLFND